MTQISSAKANKLFNAALFTESVRWSSFARLFTGAAPKPVDTNKADARKQTSPGAPIVRITDLGKVRAERVTVDLIAQLNGLPTMGDEKIAGNVEDLKFSEFEIKIDQGRKAVDSGGRMTQQRTMHDLKSLARKLIAAYYSRLEDQTCLVHLAGARGDNAASDWIVPLASNPKFNRIMVNPITPPTFDRHYYGGNATAIDDIDSTDKFSLSVVDNLRLILDEMAFPLQPIKMEGDEMSEDSPFYCLNVTPRQWYDFWTGTDGATWRALQANAQNRGQYTKHPLFKGDVAMWQNILIRKQRRPIRFNTGSVVTVCTDTVDAQTTTVQPATPVERAVLLGAQALGNAFGMSGKKSEGGYHFSTNEEKTDHKNAVEHSIAWMNGKAKIRFEGTDGRINDFGVMVVDTAVS